jgi:hypothetical protein
MTGAGVMAEAHWIHANAPSANLQPVFLQYNLSH